MIERDIEQEEEQEASPVHARGEPSAPNEGHDEGGDQHRGHEQQRGEIGGRRRSSPLRQLGQCRPGVGEVGAEDVIEKHQPARVEQRMRHHLSPPLRHRARAALRARINELRHEGQREQGAGEEPLLRRGARSLPEDRQGQERRYQVPGSRVLAGGAQPRGDRGGRHAPPRLRALVLQRKEEREHREQQHHLLFHVGPAEERQDQRLCRDEERGDRRGRPREEAIGDEPDGHDERDAGEQREEAPGDEPAQGDHPARWVIDNRADMAVDHDGVITALRRLVAPDRQQRSGRGDEAPLPGGERGLGVGVLPARRARDEGRDLFEVGSAVEGEGQLQRAIESAGAEEQERPPPARSASGPPVEEAGDPPEERHRHGRASGALRGLQRQVVIKLCLVNKRARRRDPELNEFRLK